MNLKENDKKYLSKKYEIEIKSSTKSGILKITIMIIILFLTLFWFVITKFIEKKINLTKTITIKMHTNKKYKL